MIEFLVVTAIIQIVGMICSYLTMLLIATPGEIARNSGVSAFLIMAWPVFFILLVWALLEELLKRVRR